MTAAFPVRLHSSAWSVGKTHATSLQPFASHIRTLRLVPGASQESIRSDVKWVLASCTAEGNESAR